MLLRKHAPEDRKIELIDGNFDGNVLPVMDEYLNEMAYDFNTANYL